MATNFKPNYTIHPGVFLKEEMDSLKISQKSLAEQIGVSKTIINEVINEKRRINAELAVKLEKVLYSPASYWLNLQALYDETEARIKLNAENIENSEEQIQPINLNLLTIYTFAQTYNIYQCERKGVA